MHLLAGVAVAVSGAASGVFVVIANAWMNAPAGFELVDGRVVGVDPLAAMANPAAFTQTLHMTLAAYAATGFTVAGIHAFFLLRQPAHGFHRRALAIGLIVGAPAAVLQPLSGDLAARYVARHQPAKLAAMEALFETQRGAPLLVGGIPDVAARTTRYGLEIPRALSLLAFHHPDAEVRGLDAFPRADWPNVTLVHLAFQIMVGLGIYLALIAVWAGWLAWRRVELWGERRFLQAVVLAMPMGLVAVEAGWMVTELGRQPWVVYGVLRTADAVTPMPGLVIPFVGISILYLFLSAIVVWLLHDQMVRVPAALAGTPAAHPAAGEASRS
jgi:cytochrome d ubiquinol oxidase subunit I